MDNEIETTFWNKKSDDVTVGDTVKLMGIVTAVSIAVPVAAMGVYAGVLKIGYMIRSRRSKETVLCLVENEEKED